MLGKRMALFLIFVFLPSCVLCHAQPYGSEDKNLAPSKNKNFEGRALNYMTITGREVREKDFKLGPGMEVITVRGVNVVAPVGTRVEDKGSWIKIEDLGEFLGRKFSGIETRLRGAEKKQKELSEELEQLKIKMQECEIGSDKGGKADE
jgi:hypothetical protein